MKTKQSKRIKMLRVMFNGKRMSVRDMCEALHKKADNEAKFVDSITKQCVQRGEMKQLGKKESTTGRWVLTYVITSKGKSALAKADANVFPIRRKSNKTTSRKYAAAA